MATSHEGAASTPLAAPGSSAAAGHVGRHGPARERGVDRMAGTARTPDVDAGETTEWAEALEAVLERDGPERAHFLLETLIDKARRSGAYLPYTATTAYVNTIPPGAEARSPGDAALEWRIRSIIRWNRLRRPPSRTRTRGRKRPVRAQ